MHLDLLNIPQQGGGMSKRLGGIIGCKDKTSSSPMVVTLDQQYNVGEKPPVILFAPLFLLLLFFFLFSVFDALIGALYVCTRLIFSCPADHIPDWQSRILLGMVEEAQSVNVKKTHAHTHIIIIFHLTCCGTGTSPEQERRPRTRPDIGRTMSRLADISCRVQHKRKISQRVRAILVILLPPLFGINISTNRNQRR